MICNLRNHINNYHSNIPQGVIFAAGLTIIKALKKQFSLTN